MKKAVSILAVAVLTLGMISCEAETDVQDTVNLFESLDQDSVDGKESDNEDRDN